ncbi:MAG: D-glycero-beta-D-manno-heptose 1,7-bisphosphate 7-phosphatase [Gammaproteobacteria bacterium]|nr:D-glycero-beta-D-manno-heptose 1,7-bisphosphate 7-phosphatase [Gammaproteobacteria bacterium]
MKLIVLDRDGVINRDRIDYVKCIGEWEPIPGSLEAMARLTRAGYDIVIATNQSGVGRGLYNRAAVNAIHARLRREAGLHGARILGFYVCPHAPLAGCDCRKPAAGMLQRIARDADCKPERLIFIGDSWKDLAAARKVGARPILVRTGQGESTLERERARGREPECYADLAAAADRLVAAAPGPVRRVLGSIAFNVGYVAAITVFAIATLAAGLMAGQRGLQFVAHGYAATFYGLLRLFTGLDYRMQGLENIPDAPCVFYWKHQSTWETLMPFLFIRRPAFVLKRELLWIPLVGWALACTGAIGIDRNAHREALSQIRDKGTHRLARGFSVVIFPEGHRMPPGVTRRYGRSGALLASAAGVPIVPVAHNAGDFWPRRGFIKRPGTVQVRIGTALATANRPVDAINLEAREWIEGEMRTISVGYLIQGDRPSGSA